MTAELTGYDAMALGDLIRKGEISPVELLEITIQRIEKINPHLNSVIYMFNSHPKSDGAARYVGSIILE